MSFLAKFTNVNPRARLNFSWERSARRLVEVARHQYKETYGEAELPPRGQFVEQALVALLMKDQAFRKLADSVDEKHPWFAEIKAALDEDEKEDKKSEKGAKPAKSDKPAPAAPEVPAKAPTPAPAATPAPTPSAVPAAHTQHRPYGQ